MVARSEASADVCLRWIPGIRMLQRHPFTLVSTQPASFVIQAHDGFTKALHLAACLNPGGKYHAAIEGPYCVVPDTRGFDKVVLIAGGTGATFTVAMALEWARRHRMSKQRSTLDFIWTVRNKDAFGWLDVELAELKARLGVSVSLYVSGQTSTMDEKTGSSSTLDLSSKTASSLSSVQLPASTSPDEDLEKMTIETSTQSAITQGPTVKEFESGRPDLPSLVKRAVSRLEIDDRVLVIGEFFSLHSNDHV